MLEDTLLMAPTSVKRLVDRFRAAEQDGSAKRLKETQVRREFIDPLFEALGWDMANVGGANESDKDVVHEYSLQDPAGHLAPDYSFQVGGERVFFVEAKRPAVDINTALSPAFQLRSYGWSGQLPLSVLTDFRHLAMYDCREEPSRLNKADYARVFVWDYSEYVDRWPEIEGMISKRAVINGSVENWAKSVRPRKGSLPPDVAFLKLIEAWREELAQSFSMQNPQLSAENLNATVQTTIDRILFLRIAEDRGLEPYRQLLDAKGGVVYANLARLFVQADDKYNSGIFHFRKEPGRATPDDVTLSLRVDNGVLRRILDSLYFPNSAYRFDIIPIEILGQVYERFLGKIIYVDPRSRKTQIEDKPEVRKAGGIYYTPEYIVDYMVDKTVGAWLRGKSVREAAGIKILDPACGSGTFLIRCYDYLLKWHLERYTAEPKKYKSRLRTGQQNVLILTAEERKKILLRSIFGVDKDLQAVETTKLSLLLKVLEGETAQSIRRDLTFLKERALPDLDKNIKNGNSLIESDFFGDRDLGVVSDEELKSIKPFDWKDDFLKELQVSAFDVVIGNPPYIFTREQIPPYERAYFTKKFKTSFDKHNTFALFIELMSRLLSPNGFGSYIVPNSLLTIASLDKLRALMVPRLRFVADLNYTVFEGVSMEPCIFGIAGKSATGPVQTLRAYSKADLQAIQFEPQVRSLFLDEGSRISFQRSSGANELLERVRSANQTIGDVFDVRSGLQAYEKGKGTPKQTAADVKNHVFDHAKRIDRNSVRYLGGSDVRRYFIAWSGLWMQYGPWLSQPRTIDIFTRPRVLLREITGRFPRAIIAAFVDETYLNNKSVLNILDHDDNTERLVVLTAILNSRFMSLFYKERAVKSARKLFPKIVVNNLREFPYPRDMTPAVFRSLYQASKDLAELTDQTEHKEPARTAVAQTLRRMELLERRVNELVCAAFGLVSSEVAVVDAALYE